MRFDPYIHLVESESETSAFFVILLNSIASVRDDSESLSQTILNQQSDFIATLIGLGEHAAIELRYVCAPDVVLPQEGKIDIAFRVKVSGATEQEAKDRAVALYQSFTPNVLSISSYYSWRVVQTLEEYELIVPEKTRWQVREMLRRERYVPLEKVPHPLPVSPIGFYGGKSVEEEAQPETGEVYVCFPFLRNYETLRSLFTELLHQQKKVIVSVMLTPTKATESEYQFVLEQLLTCERHMQLPVHGSVGDPNSFFPSLRQQSSILGEQIQNELNTLRDDVFLATIHVMSEVAISRMLCESIGVVITEHLNSNDPESDVDTSSRKSPYNGGYAWVSPGSQVKRRQAINAIKVMRYAGLSSGALDDGLRIRRLFDINQASCAFRLPVPLNEDFPGLDTSRVIQLPPPTDSHLGLSLGLNTHGSAVNRVCMQSEDRLRHTYVVGKTGTGKSTFLKNNIMQDILSGEGVGVFDPHGELIDELIDYIPKERIRDVVWVKPELDHCSIGLNLFDVQSDLEKDSVINYLIEVFGSIFNMDNAGGPMFEMYFRNAVLLLLTGDGTPHTILDIHRIFEDLTFRAEKLKACTDPMVVQFWKGQALQVGGEASLENIAPYITSKLVRLTHTSSMRKIFSQPKSTIDFEDIIENRKILLVDLSKGELGSLSSYFLGMTLIKLMQMVAFRRQAKGPGEKLVPYYLYFDEFQNLATPSFLDLLSESRKYGLAMTLANQYIQQIPEEIREAILGNVGAIVSFRVGLRDAKELEDSFAPSVLANHFINLPNYHAYVSMLKNGDVCRPFNISTENLSYKVTPGGHERLLKQMANYTRPSR